MQVPAFVEREHEFRFLAVRDDHLLHTLRLLSFEHQFFPVQFACQLYCVQPKELNYGVIEVLNRHIEHFKNSVYS
jgi:hypothetical protein